MADKKKLWWCYDCHQWISGSEVANGSFLEGDWIMTYTHTICGGDAVFIGEDEFDRQNWLQYRKEQEQE